MKTFVVTVTAEFVVEARDEDEALGIASEGVEEPEFFWDDADVSELDPDDDE